MSKIISFIGIILIAAISITTLTNSSYAGEDSVKAYSEKTISRYPVPDYESLPDDVKQIFKGAENRMGFVPNIIAALAHRPEELKAFGAYNAALSSKESGISKAEKEMFLIATSAANGCTYCVVSHGAALRLATSNPYIADQIAANYKEADITMRERAIIDFAMKVTLDSKSISEEDFETLHKHGLSNEDIWDIAAVTALYNLSNRMMNFAKVRPDEEFYMLGRK